MKTHRSARMNHHPHHHLRSLLCQLTLVAFFTASWGVLSTSALRLPPSSIFPTQDQGYGYRNYFAKRTIFPTEDGGHGYRNSFAKRTIFPTEEDEGYGYRDSFSKRIISIDDQGHGFRNYRAKRIFPTEDQGHGYRNYYAKRTIVPVDDQGHGFRDYRAKRMSPDSSSVCNLCIMTYDPDYCIRCWWSKSAIVPIYAKKRSSSITDSGESSGGYGGGENDFSGGLDGAREASLADLEQAGQLEKREEKRGNYSAGMTVEEAGNSGLSAGSQPLYRYQRGSAVCGCCYLSRLSNRQCCEMCQLTTKRSGNPLMSSEGDEGDVPSFSKRAYMINPDCFCCLRNGGHACCSGCFAK